MNPRILLIVTIGVLCYALADSKSDVGFAAQAATIADAPPLEPATDSRTQPRTRADKPAVDVASHKASSGSGDPAAAARGVPPNDDCVFAEDAAVPSQVNASTLGASFDAAPYCDTDNTAPGVWYRVIGTGNTMRASMCIELVDPNYDPKISVYCGGCDVLFCVAGNDDGYCPDWPIEPSDVSWCSIAGAEYLVLVHGWQESTGRAYLDFSDDGDPFCDGRVSCVAGDDCDDANVIPSVPFTTTFDNSTALPGNPPGSCNDGSATAMDNDVWYRYTARTDCELSVNVNPGVGAGYDGLAVVHKGPDCLNLTEIACLDDPEIGSVSVTAGMTYWIQIGDWGAATGGGLTTLDVDCRPKSACCIQGDCVDGMPQPNCQEQGGTWFDGVTCVDAPCSEACCLSNLECVDVSPGECRANAGIPRGPGTNCTTHPCPQPPQACCLADTLMLDNLSRIVHRVMPVRTRHEL